MPYNTNSRIKSAKWNKCLQLKTPACSKVFIHSHNVLAPNVAQHSKKMRQSNFITATANNLRWKRISMSEFKRLYKGC